MLADTHTQRVLDLASQKGLLRASDLDVIDAPRVVLTRLTAAGILERVGRGLYRLPDAQTSEFESLATVATKVPQAVFCLLTALQFHELTTQLPRQIWIAMPRGSHVPRIGYPRVKMVQMTGDVYTAGVEEHLRDGVKLRVYGAAKDGRGLLQAPKQDRPGRGAGGPERRLEDAQGVRRRPVAIRPGLPRRQRDASLHGSSRPRVMSRPPGRAGVLFGLKIC